MAVMIESNGAVRVVIISHSAEIATGLAEMAGQVAGGKVEIVAVGGAIDGSLGSDGGRVFEALQSAANGPGAVVLVDLGSSILAVRAALNELTDDERARIAVADAPLVEGAVAAAVAASAGFTQHEAARAAEEARVVAKL
jgi:dihydroxyacetone kinase phosphotransfer subunit